MVVQGAAIVNLIIAVIGSMSCIFSIFYILFGIKNDMEAATLTFILSVFLLVRNACLAFLQLTQGQVGELWQTSIYLAGFGTFLYSLLSSWILSFFILNKVSIKKESKLILRIVFTVVMVFGIAFLLWAQFAGKLVKIDSNSIYYLGDAYYYNYIMVAVYIAFDIFLIFKYGKLISQKQRVVYILFMLAPLIATLAKPLYSKIHLATLLSSISLLLLVMTIVNDDRIEFRRQESLKKQLEIDLLLGQIQPHFLFNVLYVIQELCCIDPVTASRAIEDFSKYLRHNMDSISIRTPIPFKEELEHVKHYVSLQQMRFGDALDVQYELGCTDFSMPTLTLQPIVENAVRYGVRMAPKGRGRVLVRTSEHPDFYEIDIIDNGPGFDVNHVPDDGISHTGLSNVRERLRYISNGELTVISKAGEGTTVRMTLPKE